jgi:hypothetical protein
MPGVSPLSPPYLTPNLRNNRSTGRRDMKTVCIPALAVTFLTLGPVPASAQTETVQEGTVLVDGRRLELPVSYLRLNENSIVRTENGRVEIGLAGGDGLFLAACGILRSPPIKYFNPVAWAPAVSFKQAECVRVSNRATVDWCARASIRNVRVCRGRDGDA